MKEPGEPCFLENSPKSIEDIACVMIVRNERERERSQRPVEFGSKVRWTSRIREADYICRGIVDLFIMPRLALVLGSCCGV